MSFPKYEVYKDSGVEWLGEVPEQWKVVPFSLAIEYQEGPGIMTADFHDEGVPLLRISGVQQRWANLQGCNYLDPAKVKSKWSHFQLEHGDLLISASASVGTICEIGEEAVGAIPYTGLIRLKPRLGFSDKNFVRFIVGSFQFSTQIDLFKAGSTIQHFGPTHLSQMKVVLPPISKQTQIARFLDRETARIDALIAEQQRLIELLKEKRQAVISHAVTKGIDRTVPMKDSGVEWLGEVPEHWICKSYRYASVIYRGKFGHRPRNDPSLYDGEYAFIQTGDIARAEKYIQSYKQTLNQKGANVSQKFLAGTLVMAIAANIGDTAILGFEAYAPDSVVGFKPEAGIEIEFLRFSLMAAIQELQKTATQSTQANLNIDRIGSIKSAFPPISEQLEIVKHLNKLLEKYAELESQAAKTIEMMQERRSALISAAVTGKIDVRK
jgi:type I restriction enzyme, S subunit